jgi:enoyl-[acyl-carrier-protein] reductase (NADH)
MAKRMNAGKNELAACRWTRYLEEVDREMARLATLCQVRILEPGVIERVLRNDASVCGTPNDVSFAELRETVAFDMAVLEILVHVIGQIPMTQIEGYVVERLKQSFPELATPWRSA